VPHLTIARIKKLNSKKYFQSVVQRYKDFDSGEIAIESIFLYQSILHKEGPEYRVLQEYRLL
jgi:2'-5' RNA ligase